MFRTLTVTNGATLEVQSTPDIVSHLAVQEDVCVAAGATLSANGMGFPNMSGPGAPLNRGGGSYGGIGSGGNTGAGGPRYGSIGWPDALGSGGGYTDRGGHGGGILLLDVGGSLDVEGTISANGWNFEGGYAGGGSGGSIWIVTDGFEGTGELRAHGGNAPHGGGGGGRIAVWHGTIREHERQAILDGINFSRLFIEETPPETFTGAAWVNGGSGSTGYGADGTVRFIHVVQPPAGTLFIIR